MVITLLRISYLILLDYAIAYTHMRLKRYYRMEVNSV